MEVTYFFCVFQKSLLLIFVPNRTFLVRFGDISCEFDRAMVRILARCSRARKKPMARPNEPDMSPKRTKKERLGIRPYPNSGQNPVISCDFRSMT